MKVFGYKTYVLIKDNSNGKFDSKSEQCVLVGHSNEAKAYRLWNPRKPNLTISRDVMVLDKMYFKNEYENIYENLESNSSDDVFLEIPLVTETPKENAEISDDESDFEGFEDCNLVISENPSTIAEMLQDGDQSWVKAVEDEYVAQLLNKTWEIVEPNSNWKPFCVSFQGKWAKKRCD